MRDLINLSESVLPTLYHGSRVQMKVGTILTAQEDGYVTYDFPEKQHALTEKLMEKYRPHDCVSRFGAVFSIADADDIDNAGGYNDFVYEVETSEPTTRCNLHWYSQLYMLCEHEVLSQEEAKRLGEEYPEQEEPEVKEYALNYWHARQSGDYDLFEYLSKTARILRIIP